MRGKTKLKKKEKANKGITLIALVITIIVLLILAAVSIATLTGENGILTKANTAKTRTILEEEKEQIKLAYSTVIADKLEKGDKTAVTTGELEIELKKLNPDVTVTSEGDKIKVTFNKTENSYMIDSNGNITGSANSEENEGTQNPPTTVTTIEEAKTAGTVLNEKKPTTITDQYENQVVVPEGFKIAEDSGKD